MTYPDLHPKTEEIRATKATIDTLYAVVKRYEESAREHYKFAMENLKGMGEDHKKIHETLRAIAENMTILKGLIDSPLI